MTIAKTNLLSRKLNVEIPYYKDNIIACWYGDYGLSEDQWIDQISGMKLKWIGNPNIFSGHPYLDGSSYLKSEATTDLLDINQDRTIEVTFKPNSNTTPWSGILTDQTNGIQTNTILVNSAPSYGNVVHSVFLNGYDNVIQTAGRGTTARNTFAITTSANCYLYMNGTGRRSLTRQHMTFTKGHVIVGLNGDWKLTGNIYSLRVYDAVIPDDALAFNCGVDD